MVEVLLAQRGGRRGGVWRHTALPCCPPGWVGELSLKCGAWESELITGTFRNGAPCPAALGGIEESLHWVSGHLGKGVPLHWLCKGAPGCTDAPPFPFTGWPFTHSWEKPAHPRAGRNGGLGPMIPIFLFSYFPLLLKILFIY